MAAEVVRILLVEDNQGDARLLQEFLREVTGLRTQLRHVTKLADAEVILRQGDVDVLLLDLSLPDAHGIETVKRADAAAPLMPIVVMTGLDDEGTALRAMQVGAQDYLVKGQVDGQILSRAIRYARERKRAEVEARALLKQQAARAEAEEKRSRFLAEVSRTLAASLGYETTISSVALLAVPVLADCCILDLMQENGEVRTTAVATRDGLVGEDTRHAARFLSSAPEQDPAARALRTGEPVLLDAVPDGAREVLHLPAGMTPPKSAIALPLVARRRTLGAMTFLSTERAYNPDDVALAGELAGRAALAIDNARLFRAREEVLHIVGHDLRQPLSVILGNVGELLREKEGQLPELETVNRAAIQMGQLIKDLMDAARVDGGKLSIQPERVGIAVLLEEAEERLYPVAKARNIALEVEDAEGLPFLRADRERVHQVLSNLVGNAVKFTPEGGTVTLGVERDGTEARFSVADTGPGIPEKDRPYVFDKGWQKDKKDNRGVGLGLSIAKGIIEAHGGRIWVGESRGGKGATFFFTLPFDGDASPDEDDEA